jgi:hypothetical protein
LNVVPVDIGEAGEEGSPGAVAYPGIFEYWADSQQNFSDYWAIEAYQNPTGP